MPLEYAQLFRPIDDTRFARLRASQERVLQGYAAGLFNRPDIAIELPTGAGKTLIALLVLDYWRNEGNRVAILTGNKTLARQIEAEAAELRVPTVRFEGAGRDFPPGDVRRYHRAQAIAVMNYWAYINQNPGMQPAQYVVLDDAQLADGALASLYTVSVSRKGHPTLFGNLMRLIDGLGSVRSRTISFAISLRARLFTRMRTCCHLRISTHSFTTSNSH
jgi:hypothetical protein